MRRRDRRRCSPKAKCVRARSIRREEPAWASSARSNRATAYKHTKIKQYHKERRALRTETTINDTGDFEIRKRLTHLPALREIGVSANRRLLGVQRLSHNPIRAAEALAAVQDPIVTDTGARIPGLRQGHRRAHALLQALLMFRLLPHGFRNHDLRGLLAGLLGKTSTTSASVRPPTTYAACAPTA